MSESDLMVQMTTISDSQASFTNLSLVSGSSQNTPLGLSEIIVADHEKSKDSPDGYLPKSVTEIISKNDTKPNEENVLAIHNISGSKIEDVKTEIFKFFKTNQKENDLEIYKAYFNTKKTEFLTKIDLPSILGIYLDGYIDCYFNTALVRAKVFTYIMKSYDREVNFEKCVKVFNVFLTKCIEDCLIDDYPH